MTQCCLVITCTNMKNRVIIKVTVDLQETIFCDFSLSRQTEHYQFNYIFQKKNIIKKS